MNPSQRSPDRRVIMFSRELSSYRVAFLEMTRDLLLEQNVEFRLLVGGGTSADRSKKDSPRLDWAEPTTIKHLRWKGREVWWQSGLAQCRSADLVITEQATKQLLNIPLALGQRLGVAKHALWGHGRNFQASIEGGSGESLKQRFTKPAHWFFSYTDASTKALHDLGYPDDRVTTVNNSTDVEQVRDVLAQLPPDNETAVRNELGLGSGPIVGYIGGLTEPKRIPFLLDAIDILKKTIPELNVLIMGAGTEEGLVRDAARDRPWLHALGPVYGAERVRYGAVCSALLMPGLLGLNVVDGFALGLPTITTGIDYHSPEIAYLDHARNGWISNDNADPDEYASDVAAILGDHDLLRSLQAEAWKSGNKLGIKAMSERFVEGVLAALEAPPRQ